jgi:hypothetical protein
VTKILRKTLRQMTRRPVQRSEIAGALASGSPKRVTVADATAVAERLAMDSIDPTASPNDDEHATLPSNIREICSRTMRTRPTLIVLRRDMPTD